MATLKILNAQGNQIAIANTSATAETMNTSAHGNIYVDGVLVEKMTRCEEKFGKGSYAVFVSCESIEDEQIDAQQETYEEMDEKWATGKN